MRNILATSAELVLTSYDSPKINSTISQIRKTTPKMHVTIKGKPVKQKITYLKGKPRMWGCSRDDIQIRTMFVSGTKEDLRKLTRIKTPDGVFTQLFINK